MPVLYVDTEHDLVRAHAERGLLHRARIEDVRNRLADAAGQPCLVRRYTEIDPAHVALTAPAAMVIGGSFTDWSAYDDSTLAGLLETIRAAPVPILGICAGHQLIGRAHGAAWGPLGPLQPGEIDPEPGFAPGLRKERGFLPVEVDPGCSIFHGLPSPATLFQHHYWQLQEIPVGFVARATSRWSAIQAIEQLDRPVFGVQFHAERSNSEHPHGAAVLGNFFALAHDLAARGGAIVSA